MAINQWKGEPRSSNLAKAREVHQKRLQIAQELKSRGNKVIGYFCCYTPVELITALGMVPCWIMGNLKEPITEADTYLETEVCPYIRNCFDRGLKGDYSFLDGVVVPHSCENVRRIYPLWVYQFHPPYFHFLDVPHVVSPASLDFFMTEIGKFKASLEELAGHSISNEGLQEAVRLYNENRRLLREIYDFRKEIPPLLSGVEAMEIVLASLSIPVMEVSRWLKEVIQEVRTRPRLTPEKVRPRILVYGSEMDDIALVDLVEQCGADVVMDDLCLGTRHFWHDVELTQNPLEDIAVRCLDKILCPRTYRGGSPRDRFSYLQDYLRDFEVRGVLLYILRFCDTHGYDAVDVKDYLDWLGVPVLWLDSDYSLGSIEQMRTRIQAFVELLD